MNRYSAKLLFQFRVVENGQSRSRRWCEERTICFHEVDAQRAVLHAREAGREGEYDYCNDRNDPVYFEFLGVMDMIELGVECGPEEVWYDIRQRVKPQERKNSLVLDDEQLLNRISASG